MSSVPSPMFPSRRSGRRGCDPTIHSFRETLLREIHFAQPEQCRCLAQGGCPAVNSKVPFFWDKKMRFMFFQREFSSWGYPLVIHQLGVVSMSGHEDVVVPWRESNTVAVDLITQHIRTKLGHFFRCVCLKWATGCC